VGDGVTVAMSGKLDYGGEPRLALGIACNPMPAAAFKRLWPAFLSPKVRDWVIEHITSGNVERLDIATNATFAQMQPTGPAMPEEGLSVEIVGSAVKAGQLMSANRPTRTRTTKREIARAMGFSLPCVGIQPRVRGGAAL
jgi:hypothetical protein